MKLAMCGDNAAELLSFPSAEALLFAWEGNRDTPFVHCQPAIHPTDHKRAGNAEGRHSAASVPQAL